jgi:hypothetical protein
MKLPAQEGMLNYWLTERDSTFRKRERVRKCPLPERHAADNVAHTREVERLQNQVDSGFLFAEQVCLAIA